MYWRRLYCVWKENRKWWSAGQMTYKFEVSTVCCISRAMLWMVWLVEKNRSRKRKEKWTELAFIGKWNSVLKLKRKQEVMSNQGSILCKPVFELVRNAASMHCPGLSQNKLVIKPFFWLYILVLSKSLWRWYHSMIYTASFQACLMVMAFNMSLPCIPFYWKIIEIKYVKQETLPSLDPKRNSSVLQF